MSAWEGEGADGVPRLGQLLVPSERFGEVAEVTSRRRRPEEVQLERLVSAAATGGDWRAAAWLLERRWPERWARLRLEPPVVVESDELDDLARRRDARRAGG